MDPLLRAVMPIAEEKTLAHLYEEGRRRERWLEAGLSVSQELSAPERLVDAAPLARDLHGGPAVVAEPAAVFGDGAREKLGETLVVPLGPSSGPCLLVLARSAGAEAYTQADLDAAAVFGSHVDAALGLSEERRRREEALISMDRDRIARDLHEVVIQRLFAAGLSLQSLRANAVRHSGGTIVALSLTLEGGALELLIQDDGRGFAQSECVGGVRIGGLASMRQRAASLGGTSAVRSAPGQGTTVRWTVHLPQS